MPRFSPVVRILAALLPGAIIAMSAGAEVATSPVPDPGWSAVALALLDKGGTTGAIAALVLAVLLWGPRFKLPAVPVRMDGPIKAELSGPIQLVLLRHRQGWDGDERRGRSEERDDDYETIEIRLDGGRRETR